MNKILSGFLFFLLVGMQASSDSPHPVMTFEVGKFNKDYEIKTPVSDVEASIPYVYDFYDNVDLIESAAYKLAHKVVQAGLHMQLDTVIVPGDKANSIGLSLVQILRHLKPSIQLVVLRGSSYGAPLFEASYQSSTQTEPHVMQIRPDQLGKIKGKRILIVDDVISTGSTVNAAKDLVEQAEGTVVGVACVATEGMEDPGESTAIAGLNIIRLTHFPEIPSEN